MIVSLRHFLGWMFNACRSREDLVLENLALRRQLLALRARRPRHRLTTLHKLFWIVLRTFWSGWTRPLVLVLLLVNTITYYLPFLPPPCYARFGRALICHEKAPTGSSLPNKSGRSWNDAPINIRCHILLWRGPR